MNVEEMKITDNEFLRQFETEINGELCIIEYSQQDRKIFLTKIKVSEKVLDRQNDFIEAVLSTISETNMRVVPTNPTIAGFMRTNRRKYKDLLPVGINI
ncbi:N-acetyltransferase [uncultured Christiangramia sp.]|uniref:GNAT family N-acetyltransferase n=1 Tax=uncultured Christiangramia sp. TaxID=503836 RepID=UPI0025D18B2E|nr:N-acetyltransferase [uncultured Christiangramia sp.]|tara:strand:+ start:848 stop:1144 length:297 start_codon:yes stop_codon:yes gene_type:complete